MAANKDFKPILAELKRQKWAVEQTTKGHFRAAPPDPNRSLVTFSVSNEPRAIHNTISKLRSNGFVWPPPIRSEEDLEAADSEENEDPDSWIEEHNQRVEAETPPEGEATPPPRPETHEERMDRLFSELKEAKTYLALTGEQLAACKKTLDEAQAAYSLATDEHVKAEAALQSKKAEFDAAFEGRAA